MQNSEKPVEVLYFGHESGQMLAHETVFGNLNILMIFNSTSQSIKKVEELTEPLKLVIIEAQFTTGKNVRMILDSIRHVNDENTKILILMDDGSAELGKLDKNVEVYNIGSDIQGPIEKVRGELKKL